MPSSLRASRPVPRPRLVGVELNPGPQRSDGDSALVDHRHRPPLDRRVWLMFGLVSVVLILAESSRGIVIPTLSLYQKSLGGSPAFLGVLVAMFSVGRLASSYVFGRFLAAASKAAARSPTPVAANNQSLIGGMLASLVVVVLGHAAYIAAGSVGLSMLLVARLLVGFGTGTLVLARTFVGDQIPTARKARFMAWLGIEQFVGFAFTPALGSIAVDAYIGKLHLTQFNFGSYLLAILTAIVGGALYAVKRHWRMREQQRQRDLQQILIDTAPANGSTTDAAATNLLPAAPSATVVMSSSPSVPSTVEPAAPAAVANSSIPSAAVGPNNSMLWLLVAGNLAVRGSLSIAETFGALIFYNIITGVDDPDRVTDSSLFFFGLGCGGVLVFLLVERLVEWVTARWALLLGAAIGILGYAIMADWDADLGPRHFVFGMILIWSISSPIVQTVIATQLSIELAEQRERHAATTVSLGAAGTRAPPVSQALWMGHLTAAGSIGRILFPLLGGAVYSDRATGGVMLLCVAVHIGVFGAYAFAHRGVLVRDLRMLTARILTRLGYLELAARLQRHELVAASNHADVQLPEIASAAAGSEGVMPTADIQRSSTVQLSSIASMDDTRFETRLNRVMWHG